MICRKCQRETPSDALYCPYCGVSLEAKKNTRKPRTRPNGAGTAFKRGKLWYAQVTVGKKPVIRNDKPAFQSIRVTKGGFEKKKDALNYCPKLLEESQNKKQKKMLTMQQIYDAWLPIHETKVGKSTMDCYKAAWKYFKPIHNMSFQDVDLDDLQECVDDCTRGKRTKENMKVLAGLLMKYAIPRHLTDMNYAEFLDTGNGKKRTRPAFDREHIDMIRRQVGITPYADYVYTLVYTGMRPAELFSLKKSDYRDGIIYGGIKTEAGRNRAIPVAPQIKQIVDSRLIGDSEYLFPRADGSQMPVNYFRDSCFYPVLKAAGIQEMPTEKHPAYYTPYSCRHTFANLLKDAPGSDKDKAGLIGHEDYRTTKKHYQSAELEAFKKIIAALK